MARILKNVVNYFPHDANACVGDTLTVLQSRFGNDGYAFWFKLLEKLASTEGHCLDCSNPTKWQLLLAKTGVNEITGVEIMNLLVEMQAIDKELWGSKLIWSQNFVDNVSDVYKNRRREIPPKPITTAGNAITTGGNAIITGEGTQSKVKDSILKDTIVVGGVGETDPASSVLVESPPDHSNGDEKDSDPLIEELYSVLAGTKGWPKQTQDTLWKLQDAIKDYPSLNYLLEFKKFAEYWGSRGNLKRPWLALRNWLDRAKAGKEVTNAKTGHRKLPKQYTPSPNYDGYDD